MEILKKTLTGERTQPTIISKNELLRIMFSIICFSY